jgi:hypothetical protein
MIRRFTRLLSYTEAVDLETVMQKGEHLDAELGALAS